MKMCKIAENVQNEMKMWANVQNKMPICKFLDFVKVKSLFRVKVYFEKVETVQIKMYYDTIKCPCVLYISTSERVLCMPFAGQNNVFSLLTPFQASIFN
jgi:hypothetical protein